MKTNMENKPVKTIFCAREQKETLHELSMELNGEIVATCSCGRFLKFPSSTTPDEFEALVADHKSSNEGAVTVEAIDSKLKEFADKPEEE